MTKITFLLLACFSFVLKGIAQSDQDQQLKWLDELVVITKKYEQSNSLLRFQKEIYYQNNEVKPTTTSIGELQIDAADNFQMSENRQLVIQRKETNIIVDSNAKEIIISKAQPIKNQLNTDQFIALYEAGGLVIEKKKNQDFYDYIILFNNDANIAKMIYRVNKKDELLFNEVFLTAGNYLMDDLADETLEEPRIRFQVLSFSHETTPLNTISFDKLFTNFDSLTLVANYQAYSIIDLRYKK